MSLQTLKKENFVTLPEYGEVYPKVLFRGYNWIVENWLPQRPALKQHLGEKIDFPVGTTSLTPEEVAYVWHMLETKKGDNYATLHQEMKKYAIRTGAIGVIEDKMDLVYNRDFNPKTLPAIILNPEIQTPSQEYAKKLDEIIVKRINSDENTSLDDLIKAKAKLVGGEVYVLPPLLRETRSGGLSEDIKFLGATKANFPAGVRWYIEKNPDYGNGYRAVLWRLYPADEVSSFLVLDALLESSYSYWGSLQSRRSADSGIFYTNQFVELQSEIKNVKDKSLKTLTNAVNDVKNL